MPEFNKHSDFTIQDVEIIRKSAEVNAKKDQFYGKFAEKAKWDGANQFISYNVLDLASLSKEELQELVEGRTVNPTKLAYKRFQDRVKNYGGKLPYTKELIMYNYTDARIDMDRTVSFVTAGTIERAIGKEFFKSRYQLTPATTLVETFDNALEQLHINKAQPYENGEYIAFVTPAVMKQLKKELREQKDTLPVAVKDDVITDGMVTHFDGFSIYERTDDFLTEDENSVIAFFGKSQMGNKPVKAYGDVVPEIIHNPLGSELVNGADGTGVASDANHRAGSIAWNIDNFGAVHQADEAHLVCKVPFVSTKITPTAYSHTYGSKEVA